MKQSSLCIFHRNWKIRKNLKFINNIKIRQKFGILIFIQAILIAVSEPIKLCDSKNVHLWYLNLVVSLVVYIEMLLKIIYCGFIFGNSKDSIKPYLSNFQNIFEFIHNNLNIAWIFLVNGSCNCGIGLRLIKVVNSFAGMKMIWRYESTKVLMLSL